MAFDTAMNWQSCGIGLAGGYLLGSIPFGLIFAWLAGAGDVRNIGSGNIGATNVLRTGNRWAAAATLLCDGGKGAVAVLLAQRYLGIDAALFAGLGAFLGHLFPIWLDFKGGKGFATFLGVSFALAWPVGMAHWCDMAGRGRDLAHILSVHIDRRHNVLGLHVLSCGPAPCRVGVRPDRDDLHHASRKHHAAVAR